MVPFHREREVEILRDAASSHNGEATYELSLPSAGQLELYRRGICYIKKKTWMMHRRVADDYWDVPENHCALA